MRTHFLVATFFGLAACSSSADTTTPPLVDSATDTTTTDSSTDSPTDSAITDSVATETSVDGAGDTSVLDVSSDTGTDGGSCTGTTGTCSDKTLSCQCCPAGGPAVHCTCSTTCKINADCRDPARPKCNSDGTNPGFCTANDFTCCWLCK